MKKQQKKKNVTINTNMAFQKPDFLLPSIISIIVFLLFYNTIQNGYVLDDAVAITNNQLVQKGFEGIGPLLKVDFWHFSNLNLGYFRPIALITFAIEHEFFGNNPHVSHFINVLLFAFTGFLLCLLLTDLFRNYHKTFAFFICLLFISHPIHTEVVANLKSRDELLSFLGILSVIYIMFRSDGAKNIKHLFGSLIIYYLALLSKETAIIGVVLIPAVFYFFRQKSITQCITKTIPFVLAILVFYIHKHQVIGTPPNFMFVELNNYPYAKAKFSSSMIIFLYSIKLLFFPHPLMYDYSYNQIPAGSFTNPLTIFGFVLFGFLIFMTVKEVIKKSIWGFALLVFFASFLPAIAFIWIRGGIMAERFLYAATLGFCIALVYFLIKIFKADLPNIKAEDIPAATKANSPFNKLNPYFTYKIPGIIVLVIFGLYSFKTVDRNQAWKDNRTLFSTDIVHAANSTQNNRHLGNELLAAAVAEKDSTKKMKLFDQSYFYLNRAVTINPRFGEAWGDLGRLYFDIRFIPDSAIYFFKRCIQATPGAAITHSNLGLVYQTLGKYELASYYFNRAIEINPNFQDARKFAAQLKAAGNIDVHIYPGGEDPKYDNMNFNFAR